MNDRKRKTLAVPAQADDLSLEQNTSPREEKLITSIENEQNTHFNPFIHGTNSLILPLLERTEMQVMSPIEMIRKYQLAPLGGEITGGGLVTVQDDTKPCFGRLRSNGNYNDYSLENILETYARCQTEVRGQ